MMGSISLAELYMTRADLAASAHDELSPNNRRRLNIAPLHGSNEGIASVAYVT